MIIAADVGCEKCNSKITHLKDIQIEQFDSVRLSICECLDYFNAELSTKDPREKEIEMLLRGEGIARERIPDVIFKIGLVMTDDGLGFGDLTLHIGIGTIEPVWNALIQRWPLPEFPDENPENIQSDCKVDLDLLMLEVFRNQKKKYLKNEDINRMFRWPLKLLAAAGRIHLGKECWRLK